MVDDKTDRDLEPPVPRWWVVVGGTAQGPFAYPLLVSAIQSGRFSTSALGCLVGTEQWRPLSDWDEFQRLNAAPAPLPPPVPIVVAPEQKHPLFNPRLPTMANWLCGYCIVAVPLLWAFNSLSCLMTYSNRTSFSGFELSGEIVTRVIGILVSIALVFGGLRLRDLRMSGCTIIKATIWTEIAIIALYILVFVIAAFAGVAAEEPEGTNPITAFDIFGMMINLAAFGFEIASLIWLHRYGKVLPYVAR